MVKGRFWSKIGKLEIGKLENIGSVGFVHVVYPPPQKKKKFCISIVFDSSWYDRNTLEKLDRKIMQTFGGGRGRKQGALWSM